MKTPTENIQAAFVVVLKGDGYEIGLAHKGVKGYSPNYGKCYNLQYPKIEADTYDEASDWVDHMNQKHYNHTRREASVIVASTM